MRFYKNVTNGYIVMIGIGFGHEEITKDEYDLISHAINNRPIANDGYDYRLRTDLIWEKYELPPEPSAQAMSEDYENALARMGVNV